MAKKEEKEKKNHTLLIIIIILVILLIIFLLWYFLRQKPTANDEDILVDETPFAPIAPDVKVYRTSDKLSEITFSRIVQEIEGDQTINVRETIKVSGYIQEVPLTQVVINKVIDRAYIFKNGKLEWDIYGREIESDEYDHSCEITWTVESKSSTTSDSRGKLQGLQSGNVLSGKNMLAMSYSQYGFDTDSHEIELLLEANINLPEVENIIVSGNHTICNGEKQSKVTTTDFLSVNKLPLVIRGNPEPKSAFTGSFQVEYDYYDTIEGNAFMRDGISGLPLDLFHDNDYWQVSYNVYMP